MDGMVWIPGATLTMGSDHHYPETGYVTVAERAPDPADYPGARPELPVPFSSVFV